MLERLSIRNYQSLREVDLDFKPFTVIVGPSSSGKTALVRSLKTLFENSRGTPYVSHGAKTAKISADINGLNVALERGGTTGAYSVLKAGSTTTYTKLAGSVPEDVREALGADSALQIARQFDSPYLLDETGTEVARVLGDLTNVSIIFAAVKESNRRKLESSSLLKTREGDLSQVLNDVQQFKTLPERMRNLAEAEESFKTVNALDAKISKLTHLRVQFETAQETLDRLTPVTVELPDYRPLVEAKNSLDQLKTLIANVVRSLNEIKDLKLKDELLEAKIQQLNIEYHDALVLAGQCPTCGRETKTLEVTF